MHHQLLDHINTHYPIEVVALTPAARGLVAETFLATNQAGQRFFVKVNSKPFFKNRLRQSAPAHAALATTLGHGVNRPIATRTGELLSVFGAAMVTISHYVDAPNSEQYDTAAFGRLIGEIHRITPRITTPMQRVALFEHDAMWRHLMARVYQPNDEPWHTQLTERMQPWRALIDAHYAHLNTLQRAYAQHSHEWVITHGDAGGNVVANNAVDLTIVDWDYLALAHPERDLWVFRHDEAFWRGYCAVMPDYQPDEYQLQLAAYRQYFDYMVFILCEIYLSPASVDRQPHIDNLLSLFDETNWIQRLLHIR
jgi:thiamine kinase-like enzyme